MSSRSTIGGRRRGRVLPGFGLSLGITLSYLSIIVLAPIAALVWKAGDAGLVELWAGISSPRALDTYRLTLGTALAATAFNAVVGFLLAWVLVRYQFPGRRLLDAVVDLPFALPTAVAGIALSAIFAPTGWAGALLEPHGIKVAYAPAGIAVSRRVLVPALLPAFLSGCALAFSRALGEFGAIIFIAGNIPGETEVTTLLTFIRLEEFDYPGAAGLSVAMLAMSFSLLFLVNAIEYWRQRREDRS